jgi:arylformamidase
MMYQDPAEIIDISIPIDESTCVYPGNPTVQFHPADDMKYTTITMGSHSGTHVDAPVHAIAGAENVDSYALGQFIGPVWVQEITDPVAITWDEVKDIDFTRYNRILFRTANSDANPAEWREDYVYLDGDCAQRLAQENVELLGIDAFSVKQRGSDDHRPHTALLEQHIAILEGLDLRAAEQGEYYLVALPIAFKGIDAAPVRAVLLPIN